MREDRGPIAAGSLPFRPELWDEATGNGFYKPEIEADYLARAARCGVTFTESGYPVAARASADRSPQGGDAAGGSVHEGAVPEGQAPDPDAPASNGIPSALPEPEEAIDVRAPADADAGDRAESSES